MVRKKDAFSLLKMNTSGLNTDVVNNRAVHLFINFIERNCYDLLRDMCQTPLQPALLPHTCFGFQLDQMYRGNETNAVKLDGTLYSRLKESMSSDAFRVRSARKNQTSLDCVKLIWTRAFDMHNIELFWNANCQMHSVRWKSRACDKHDVGGLSHETQRVLMQVQNDVRSKLLPPILSLRMQKMLTSGVACDPLLEILREPFQTHVRQLVTSGKSTMTMEQVYLESADGLYDTERVWWGLLRETMQL